MSELIYEDDNPSKLKLISLSKLIFKLTEASGKTLNDHPFIVERLLLTYPLFSNTHEFLSLLIERHNNLKPDDPDTPTIRTRVISILKQWICSSFTDISSDEKISNKLNQFVDQDLDPKTAMGIQMTIQALSLPSDMMNPFSIKNPENDEIVRQGITKLTLSKKIICITLDEQFLEKIAEQLTLLEFDNIRKIQTKEFLNQAWSKNPSKSAPNILSSIGWFNWMNRLFCTEIVKEENIEQRTLALSNCILLAKKCYNLGNYNTVMEILSSLHNSAIARLKLSWKNVSSKLMSDLNELGLVMSPKYNYKRLREDTLKRKPPYIPYLGMYLTDLTFLDDCKPNQVDGLINIDKVMTVGSTLKEISNATELQYNLTPLPTLQNIFICYETWDENNIYQVSKIRETGTGDEQIKENKYFINLKADGQTKIVVSSRTELSQRDWNILLDGAVAIKYHKSQYIIDKESTNTHIYFVVKGSVRLRHSINPDDKCFEFVLGKGAVFGEQVLNSNIINANKCVVRGESDDVELYVIEYYHVRTLILLQPDLFKRFFKSITIKLIRRLDEQIATILNDYDTKNQIKSMETPSDISIASIGGFSSSLISSVDGNDKQVNTKKLREKRGTLSSGDKKQILLPPSRPRKPKPDGIQGDSDHKTSFEAPDVLTSLKSNYDDIGPPPQRDRTKRKSISVVSSERIVSKSKPLLKPSLSSSSQDLIKKIPSLQLNEVKKPIPEIQEENSLPSKKNVKLGDTKIPGLSLSSLSLQKIQDPEDSKGRPKLDLSAIDSQNSAPLTARTAQVVGKDEKYCAKFGFTNNQAILQEFNCSLKEKMQHNGVLYLFQKSLGFLYKVGPVEKTLSFELAKISSVEAKEDNEIYISSHKKAIFRFSSKQERDDSCNAIVNVWERERMGLNRNEPENGRIIRLRNIPSEKFQKPIQVTDGLTEDDWNLIKKSSRKQNFKVGEIVPSQVQRLYTVISGSCELEAETPNGATVSLGFLKPGDTYGAVSFFDSSLSRHSPMIIVKEDAQLTIVEGYFINILFETQEKFAGRFFHYLCTLVVSQLQSIASIPPVEKN